MALAGQRILVCDDEKNMRQLLVDVFEEEGHEVCAVGSGAEALARLEADPAAFPVMLLDLSLPGMDGFEVLREVRRRSLDIAIIVITAFGTVDTAVRAMQAGANDFVVKPFDNNQIKGAVHRTLDARDLVAQVELALPQFVGADLTPLPIIGQDVRLKSIFRVIRKIANLNTSILITGESGTGKELVAQAIHFNGVRRDKPFVAVNCGALPESLLESEFFGHERGAFTGAHALQRGKFELADGGTLFLDEIGEMPPALQVKLLRVIQESRFVRVGGEKEIEVDVRIIAATNRDLQREVNERNFREDLFYRLNVIPIHLPSLRERPDDIPQLVRFFAKRFTERHNLPPIRLDEETLEELKQRDWPGNIRELQNVIEKTVILQDESLLFAEPANPMNLGASPTPTPTPRSEPEVREPEKKSPDSDDIALVSLGENGGIRELSEIAADAQRQAVIRAIRLCNGNKAEAAKRLGVSYKTLFNRIHELGISISTSVE